MKKLPQISEAEYEIMKVIWKKAPISTNDICTALMPEHDWSAKTIHTMLTRLTAKKAVTYEKRQRMYYYTPLICQEDYQAQENKSFLDRFYDGHAGLMISSLLSDSSVSETELKELQTIISQKLKSGE
ncbi:Regulatory protein BlaI [uncultured Roseburia sp.]|uniref:BlaI/MecI/CopY family transcriptional regulator n=1 Tax=Brotonthovivens ammoniilytica TaxID=2981725 RepID=A0ABT2TM30_9FIRM|nr:BlaI/MecI/CopY family transcriptional regulator [Brotonthovivens ammoniilytica]MCU6763282.1 BlaI/MecI/CopY family transcriptional regulator [Brotonthovivens ammoniilytica]SCJ11966.1 Regulatory protein BlaI [uncultured Roseburia sp.]